MAWPSPATTKITVYSDLSELQLPLFKDNAVNSALTEFGSLSAVAVYEWEFGRGDWQTKTYTYTKVTSDAEHFYFHAISEEYYTC